MAALTLSEWSQSTSLRERFVQLWLVPASVAASSEPGRIQIGVENNEGVTKSYVVEALTNTGTQVDEWHIRLASGAEWSRTINVTSGSSVSATLAAESDPGRVLRFVHVST